MSLPWDDFPTEELRIASVFNGGVSLAVWMGGATHELNRLVRSSETDGPYGALLKLVCSKAVADVVAGTSAGGINGAALAVAQANRNADLSVLRDVWSEQGRFESLLRKPFQGNPTSLLRGDEFFLPALSEAMTSLASATGDAKPSAPDIDVQITTSLLEPSDRVVPDDLGQLTHQQIHAAQFHFDAEDFTKTALPTTARKLALAARASASFPLAFEPTFIPVNHPESRRDEAIRPDMSDHASWKDPDSSADQSRYAADGGLLANTPLPQALKAIRERPAHVPVRRILLLIYPHAQLSATTVDVRRDEPPTVTGGLMDMVSAIRSHGGQTFLEELDAHNRNADVWRGGREDALPQAGGLSEVFDLVRVAWEPYRSMRMRLSAATLARRVQHESWSYDRIRRAAYAAQLGEAAHSPYVPETHPPSPSCLGLSTDIAADEEDNPLKEWRWGPVVASGVCDAIEALLRSAGAIATPTQLAVIRRARPRVIAARAEIGRRRKAFDEIWDSMPIKRIEPDQAYWRARLAAFRLTMTADASPAQVATDRASVLSVAPTAVPDLDQMVEAQPGREIAAQVWSAVRSLEDVLPVLEEMWGTPPAAVVQLDRWKELLTAHKLAPESQNHTLRLLIRLLALDTTTWLTANNDVNPGTNVPIQSAQLSLAVEHGFAKESKRPVDKAAGLNLGHFAGFLKRSWRSNDWIWGRLDGARLLSEVVLAPERLRRLSLMADESLDPEARTNQLLDVVAEILDLGEGVREAIHAQLLPVFDPNASLPSRLPLLAAEFALAIQRQIIVEELPHLRRAILADRSERQNPRSRGELFLAEHDGLLEDLRTGSGAGAAQADKALAAFDRAGIGREVLRDESGSDAMIQTAANTVGVVATVFSSDRFGVKALRPAAKSVRGALLLPYWALQGLTAGGVVAKLLARIGVVIGGVLLTLGLLGSLGDFSTYAAAAGLATLLAVLAYSALRTGTLLHGVVLLAAAGPLGAWAWTQRGNTEAGGLSGALAVLGLGAALWILASLPWPLLSPRALAHQALDRAKPFLKRRWRRLTLVAGLTIASAGLVVLVAWALTSWFPDQLVDVGDAVVRASEEVEAFVRRHVGWVALLGAALCVLVGTVAALVRGEGLRVRTAVRMERLQLPAGVAAMWAVVYGALCFAAALFLAWWADTDPAVGTTKGSDDPTDKTLAFSIWWLAALAALLTLVVPFWVTFVLRRRLNSEILLLAPRTDSADDFVAEMRKHGVAFVYLVNEDGSLTQRGTWLHARHRERQGVPAVSAVGP